MSSFATYYQCGEVNRVCNGAFAPLALVHSHRLLQRLLH
jgi:hypothetical protein